MDFGTSNEKADWLSNQVIGAAMEVHRNLGQEYGLGS